jgi:anti-anti-sigma factor
MTLALDDVSAEQLAMQGRLVDGSIVVGLTGTADTAAREKLEEYFTQLHAEAVRLRTPNVVVDLRELEFMNSSCLKVFVAWLAHLRELEAPVQYKVSFRSNPKLLWQRRSLAALSCFAIDLVTIETT